MTDERTSQGELGQVKERVQDAAQSAKQQSREGLRTQIDTRTTEAGAQVSSTARAIRGASDQLRQQGDDRAASMIEAVAERGERLGSFLSGANGDSVLREAEDMARRQPMLVSVGGLMLGFLAARFLKATSAGRYSGSSSSFGTAPMQVPPPYAGAVPTAGGSGVIR